MRKWRPVFVLLASVSIAAPADSPLKAYAGTWKVVRKSSGAAEELKNSCAQAGTFYVCEQNVAGSVRGLLVFAATSQPGRYITQNIQPDGRPTGKGELQINGSRWVFTSEWNLGSMKVLYRTTNVFSSPDKVHFEQEEATDGRTWKTKDSGDETRVGR